MTRLERCRNCGDYLEAGKIWFCPSCRLAYGRGAFWGGLAVSIIIGIIKFLTR